VLIYAFAELYPSPFKPYHDVQFAAFCEAGHTLRIFSFGGHRGELHPGAQRLRLVERTRSLPATLKNLPALAPELLAAVLASPAGALRTARTVSAVSRSAKDSLMATARALRLPAAPPDLCLVHGLLAQLQLGFLKALYPGVPVALYYHGGELPGIPVPHPERVAAAFASVDLVFTNTRSSRQNAIERGCEAAKIVVSPVGFDLRDFPEPRSRGYRRDGLLRLLSVGRLSEEKGTLFALQALQALGARARAGIRYRIVGDGPEAGRLRRFVRERSLEGIVQLAGVISNAGLHQEYSSADVLLLPSAKRGTWEENQACVVQEAMLSGALVAASRTGGVAESTAPCLQRFSFAPEDPAAIASVLEELCGLDEAAMAALGAEARRWTAQRYDIDEANRHLLETVVALRAARGAPSPGAGPG